MEKFLEAAAIAWNPVGEVRRRLDAATLTTSSILGAAIAAIIACNLLRMAAWDFFWNSLLQTMAPQAPEIDTSKFVVELASTVGALVAVGALWLLPGKVFEPFGRSAVGAAMLVVLAANAFYHAAFAALVYFVAGAQAWENPQVGMRTFESVAWPMAIAVSGLTLFFWLRIGLSVLQLGVVRLIGISVFALVAILVLAALVFALQA
jgi:hypothetical protein